MYPCPAPSQARTGVPHPLPLPPPPARTGYAAGGTPLAVSHRRTFLSLYSQCVTESKNRRSLAGMLLTYQCGKGSITVDVLARAPLSVLQAHVQKLQTEEFKQLYV